MWTQQQQEQQHLIILPQEPSSSHRRCCCCCCQRRRRRRRLSTRFLFFSLFQSAVLVVVALFLISATTTTTTTATATTIDGGHGDENEDSSNARTTTTTTTTIIYNHNSSSSSSITNDDDNNNNKNRSHKTDDDHGVLWSVRYYEALRRNPHVTMVRQPGSNVDVLSFPTAKNNDSSNSTTTTTTTTTTIDGNQTNIDVEEIQENNEIILCHLAGLMPFHFGTYTPVPHGFEDTASLYLAAHHLNTRNGVVVPELAAAADSGLAQCRIRFTAETADTQLKGGEALRQIQAYTTRALRSSSSSSSSTTTSAVDPTRPLPCAFVGAYRSAVSVSTALLLGHLGYPQVSPASVADELDDKTQYALFGRTLPSNAGNAIPIVQFLHHTFHLQHLAVIYVNDVFGNGYVDVLRQAIAAQSSLQSNKNSNSNTTTGGGSSIINLHLIPLPYVNGTVQSRDITVAISSLLETNIRFVLVAAYGRETHDELMVQAYEAGAAGNGAYNWFFAVTFQGTLEGRALPRNSPLHLAYRGAGLIQVSPGVPGIPSYDTYVREMQSLRNPIDLLYLAQQFPSYNEHANWREFDVPRYIEERYLLTLSNGYNPFAYEAAIALGLSACQALKEEDQGQETAIGDGNKTVSSLYFLRGPAHAAAMRTTTFTGVSGNPVVFDRITGTRDPRSALYIVNNYVEEVSGNDTVMFYPRITHLYRNSTWESVWPYIFNDGTAKLPMDIYVPPKEPIPTDNIPSSSSWHQSNKVPFLTCSCVVFFIIAGLVYLLVRENRRRKQENKWSCLVAKEELVFDNPPHVLGRGNFGVVVRAQFRGTYVAVKQVIPPPAIISTTSDPSSASPANRSKLCSDNDWRSSATALWSPPDSTVGWRDHNARKLESASAGLHSVCLTSLVRLANMSESASAPKHKKQETENRPNPRNRDSRVYRQMKQEFIEEMQYLSQLRHPCITTVMGAVLQRGEDPMLILEYMEHGSLYDILQNNTVVLEGEITLPILRDMSQGMRFLHEANPRILHGDLKAQNILVDKRFRAKVADFGFSQNKDIGGTGTPYWMAPELLRYESPNTSKSDVFSFGVILYEIYARKDPFDGEEANVVLNEIIDTHKRRRVPTPASMPDAVRLLMEDCLEEFPEQRPSFQEIDTRLQRLNPERTNPTTSKPVIPPLADIPRAALEKFRGGRQGEPGGTGIVTIFHARFQSKKLKTEEESELFCKIYESFDELCVRLDIGKVRTFDGSYMAVANIAKDQSNDHCKRVAQFALEGIRTVQRILAEANTPKRRIAVHAGFHSGPATVDMVGHNNPCFAIFGDTLNTVSRISKACHVANRIICSQSTARLLLTQWPEARLVGGIGDVTIRGKGNLRCYELHPQIDGHAPPLAVDLSADPEQPEPDLDTSLVNNHDESMEINVDDIGEATEEAKTSATATDADDEITVDLEANASSTPVTDDREKAAKTNE